MPFVRPMYYDLPQAAQAYAFGSQYLLGRLVVAPFVSPADRATGMSRQVVWLPEGLWYDFFTGETFAGDSCVAVYGTLEETPAFAPAGAIIPVGPMAEWGNVENPDSLTVNLFVGADGEFELYEDDGVSTAYLGGDWCRTSLRQSWKYSANCAR